MGAKEASDLANRWALEVFSARVGASLIALSFLAKVYLYFIEYLLR
jgi:hypothetical protein